MNLHISAVLAIYIWQLVCMTENSSDLYYQIDFRSWEIREQIMFIQNIFTPEQQRKTLLAGLLPERQRS